MKSLDNIAGVVPEIDNAEKRVLRQLIEALLYEKIIACQKTPLPLSQRFIFQFNIEQQVYIFTGQVSAFDRIRMDEDSLYRVRKDGSRARAEIYGIVMGLPVDEQRKDQLLLELEQTVQLCEWNRANLRKRKSPRRLLDCAELESAIDEGHLYHPCFKARTGFSVEDHQRYGPEAAQTFQLAWLAIKRVNIRSALPVAEDIFWQHELEKETWLLLNHRLRNLDGNLTDFALVPVHPWQWESLKEKALAPAIEHGDILYLGCVGDYYRATQSIRSLLNVSNEQRATIKLPMNLVNTSSLRIFDAHAVCSAPAISRWLKSVVDADQSFHEQYPLVLLEEYAALLYEPEDTARHILEGQLGVIWRESLHKYLSPDEQAVPFSALALMDADARPFIDDWCMRYGLEQWLNRLFHVAVLPVWHLLIKHGIALEAHAQNMILIHQDGWPQRIVLRDFHESVEYVDDYLASRDFLPNFIALNDDYKDAPPDRYYWMTSIEALRELVMDTLFVFNLAEISNLLENYYQYTESKFWQQVSNQLELYLLDKPRLKQRQLLINHSQPQVNAESLLTRKLYGAKNFLDENYMDFHHPVSNPFNTSDQVASDLETSSAAKCSTEDIDANIGDTSNSDTNTSDTTKNTTSKRDAEYVLCE